MGNTKIKLFLEREASSSEVIILPLENVFKYISFNNLLHKEYDCIFTDFKDDILIFLLGCFYETKRSKIFLQAK